MNDQSQLSPTRTSEDYQRMSDQELWNRARALEVQIFKLADPLYPLPERLRTKEQKKAPVRLSPAAIQEIDLLTAEARAVEEVSAVRWWRKYGEGELHSADGKYPPMTNEN